MTAEIRVYPDKLNTCVFEALTAANGITFKQWLLENVPNYNEYEAPLFSTLINKKLLCADDWHKVELKTGDLVECFIEPKDPVTATLAVIAVISAGVAIYYANQSIPDNYNSTVPDGSPIYSVNAQGNRPRLMGIAPEVFGRHKVFPDHLNALRREYIDGVEYIYVLLCIGVGKYSFSAGDIYIGNTPITVYGDDVQATVYAPGQDVSDHPASITILPSEEVSNFELLGSLVHFKYGNLDNFFGETIQRGRSANTLRVVIGEDADDIRIHRTEHLPAAPVGTFIEILNGGVHLKGLYEVTAVSHEAPLSSTSNYLIMESTSAVTQLTPVNSSLERTGEVADFSDLLAVGDRFPLEWRVIEPDSAGAPSSEYNAVQDGVTISKLYLSISFPEGIVSIDDDGNLNSHSVTVRVYVAGDNMSNFAVEYTYSGNTTDELAYTETININSNAENVTIQMMRVTPDDDDLQIRDRCIWESFSSEIPAATSYENVTTLALRIRGTNTLSSLNENKISAVVVRKLQTWNNSVFGSLQATDDIAPVVRYLCEYRNIPVDMDELYRLHQVWQARGDTFSAVFDNESTLWESLKRVLSVGFAEPTLDYGQVLPVRDELRTNTEFLYTPQNTIANSWKFSASLIDESDHDGVEVEYMDPVTWKPETILCLLPDEQGINPEKVRAFGVTSRDKAYQYGMRQRSTKRWRLVQHKWSTEMDGMNSRYLGHDAIAVNLPYYSQTGEITGISGNILHLSEPVEFSAGAHFILLRKPTGHASGPWQVAMGSDEYELIILNGPLDFTPVIDGSQERPAFAFGTADELCEKVIIRDIKPQGESMVAITALNDDPRVYLYDEALAPS